MNYRTITILENAQVGKTRSFDIKTKMMEFTLGQVNWDGKQSSYVFKSQGYYMTSGELKDIADLIEKLMDERKGGKRVTPDDPEEYRGVNQIGWV